MEFFEAITDNAAQHITWTLMLMGGSILMVVGTSHVSPTNSKQRSFYYLLIPAWILLAASMFFGDSVHRRVIAARVGDQATISEIMPKINSDFICQMNLLIAGAAVLTLWLTCYLIWWIHYRNNG